MRNATCTYAILFFCASSAFASDVFVGQHEAEEIRTDSSAEFSGRIVVSDQGEIVKTGAGTLSVSSVSIDQSWPAGFTVLDGSLALTLAGTAAATRPDVMDDAALWVSAADTDATHFSAGGTATELYQWYDVRETNVSSPSYLYAQASTKFTTARPQRVTTNGYAAVWFGGLSSGICMDWYRPARTRFTDKTVKHVWAVHGVLDSYGPVFSTGSDKPNDVGAFITYAVQSSTPSICYDRSLHSGYWNRDFNIPCMWNGRTWLDGLRINPYDTLEVERGFHLLEGDASRWESSLTSGFFSQRNKIVFSGGDYLCEAVVFTNVLTEAQRVQVGAYLMKKWFAPSPKCRLVVADGASASVEAGGDAIVDVSGAGSVVKTGTGNAVFRAADGSAAASMSFVGSLEAVSPLTMATSWPVSLGAGDRVTSSAVEKGRQVAVTHDASPGTIVKDGDDELVIQGIPSGAKKVQVEAGRLVLRQKVHAASPDWSTPFGLVENGDFEGYDESYFTTTPYTLPTTANDDGWWANKSAYIANWDKWTEKFVGGTKANFAFNVPPETGDCVLFVGSGAQVFGRVTVPEAGWWELSFKRQGRANNSYYGTYADIVLLPAASGTTPVAEFGRVTFNDPDKRWKKVALSTYVPAGTYRLRLVFAGGGNMLLDDLALRRVDASAAWLIPGGDFEQAALKRCGTGYYTSKPTETMDFTSENTMPGWTFTTSAGSAFNPPAGLVTYAMTNAYGISTSSGFGTLYNDSRQPEGGFVEAFFSQDGAEMSTTFTPPAGTWLLRVDAAHRNNTAGSLAATLAVGGATVQLGTVVVDKRAMTATTFPNPVTFDGSQSVTLVVTGHLGAATSGIWVDDFRLVAPSERGEMIANGGFESLVSGWDTSGTCSAKRYVTDPAAYGTDVANGAFFLTLRGPASICQDVVFPAAGVYRLSFWQHTRLTERATYGENPVRAFVVNGGVTNVIGVADAVSHTNFVQSAFDFRVDAAGTYTVGLCGTVRSTSAEAVVDEVSLMPMTASADELEVPSDLELTVAPGAKLRLDFDGTREVGSMRIGGRRAHGTVDATSHPQYVEGRGSLWAPESGSVIYIR